MRSAGDGTRTHEGLVGPSAYQPFLEISRLTRCMAAEGRSHSATPAASEVARRACLFKGYGRKAIFAEARRFEDEMGLRSGVGYDTSPRRGTF
jgi:hypothetical protein